MTLPGTEIWRGGVTPWQCDEMGHMNVQFYLSAASEGLTGLAAMLGMPRAFTQGASSTMLVREHHIRFLKEARPGAGLVMTGGLLDIEAGGISGGNWANMIAPTNQGSLKIAAGAFDGNVANLAKLALVATRSTGQLVREGTGLAVTLVNSGPMGGDQQLGALIAEGRDEVFGYIVRDARDFLRQARCCVSEINRPTVFQPVSRKHQLHRR